MHPLGRCFFLLDVTVSFEAWEDVTAWAHCYVYVWNFYILVEHFIWESGRFGG